MSDTRDPVERTLEVLLYAPIGVGMIVKDMAPSVVDTLVARGRAEIDRRGTEIGTRVTTARSLGQVAVAFGVPMLRERVRSGVDTARQRADEMLGRAHDTPHPPHTPSAPEATSAPVPEASPPIVANIPAAAPVPTETNNSNNNGNTNGDSPRSGGLPIPGYDALSASQVVERLSGLARDELDAVHAYEAAHRQRRTILGKIEQLAG